MAPSKHKPETTKVGEEILDFVTPYIHNVDDRNSVSLLSRKFYEIDGFTRKRLTVHTLHYPNPASLSKRFPFIESLTLKGPPSRFNVKDDYDIQITPWIEQLVLEFRCLKELHIRGLVVHDEDLETLARTRGKDLRSLRIKRCKGFSTDGIKHVSTYCNQLRNLCLEYDGRIEMKDDIWIHQLASNSVVLERLHVRYIDISNNTQELTLLAKNCSNSLISLKIGACYLSNLGDAFRYAVRLEQFGGGYTFDDESQLVGFQFPPNLHSLSKMQMRGNQYSSVLPLLNQITKLKLIFVDLDEDNQCLLFKRCPNLEVLYTDSGDRGLQVVGQFCKKLRKLAILVSVTHVGMIAVAKGCTNLEYIDVRLSDISNEALECVGTHLTNLLKFRMDLINRDGTTDLLLDNGILAMLMGCKKLERLDITLWRHGGLSDVGLDYIGKYGANLRSLSLTRIGNSDTGLVKLSQGCRKLRKLKLISCPFSKQAVTSSVLNMPILRYVYYDSSDRGRDGDLFVLVLTRPESQL